MSGFTTDTISHLTRSNLWTTDLKEVLEHELMAQKYVNWISSFPDGDTWNQPSIGRAEVLDYDEDQPVKYTAMDTGNFTMTITEYVQSGTYITNKMKQDSYVVDQLVSRFVPEQQRAIMVDLETKVLALGPDGQTASDSNTINGAKHRFVGSGANETITPEDFAKARYALNKAAVPLTNLVAIVDPSVEYALSTMSNLVNVSFNPTWEGIVRNGMSTGTRFLMSVYGWDVYVSEYLKVNSTSETIDSVAAAAGVNNLFFSATPGIQPFIGAMRQPVKVDSKYNMDFQRDEYVTTMRYGLKLHRPENLVVILTDTDQVYA
jgi:hypothetical protein